MIAGVDGCKGGWLLAIASEWPSLGDVQLVICQSFQMVIAITECYSQVMVDMPIGLPGDCDECPFPRKCDLLAKTMLGDRRSSVFNAPPRRSLVAATPQEFQSIHREVAGIGAGLPVWGIVPKIKEVDELITPQFQQRIHEFHPELAWFRANGNQTLASKKTEVGLGQRRSLVASSVQNLADLERWKKKVGRAVALDDIYDAIIGLKVAAEFGGDFCIPAAPVFDERGLEMQYRY